MKDRKKVKQIGLFLLYGAVTVFILLIFLSVGNISEIFAVLATADVNNVLLAALLLFVYAALSPLTVCMLTKSRKCPVSFGTTYAIGMTEHFFNGITPFSTGGQPFQVYAFSKAKVKAADSTGLLLMNFIIHMIVTNAFAVCSLFFYGEFASTSAMNIIAIIGFTMNFAVLAFMVALATSRRIRDFLSRTARALCKIKWIGKLLTPKLPALDLYFEQVQSAFRDLMKKKGTFFACMGVRAVTMAVYYAITFFLLRALHVDVGWNRLFFIICGTSFAITMVVFLPTPGSSGGIEFAFENIFASISGGAGAVSYGGMLLWRLLSYYLLMIVSLFFYIGLELCFRRRAAAEVASAAPVQPALAEPVPADCAAPEPTPDKTASSAAGPTSDPRPAADESNLPPPAAGSAPREEKPAEEDRV